jgi:hypothetical protein
VPESFAPGVFQTCNCLAFLWVGVGATECNQREIKKKQDSVIHTEVSSTKIEGSFFSVAMTTPLAAANMTFRNIKE